MRITVIANPKAGRRKTKIEAGKIIRELESSGWECRFLSTSHPAHATQLARKYSERSDLMVIIGGDGTVHEVINGLMPDPIPIAVLPVGSGNDFAGLIGCPADATELRELIERGVGLKVDLLDMGFRYCVNSAGLGFEAMVTEKSLGIRNLQGIPLYALAALKALRSPSPVHFRIIPEEGGEITGEKLLVSIGNGRSAGGGFFLTPDAVPDDGMIDLCIAEPMSRLKILSLLPRVLKGRHGEHPGITMLRTRSATIESEEAFHLHIDGEYLGCRKWLLKVRVLDRKLPVLCRTREGIFKHAPERILEPPR